MRKTVGGWLTTAGRTQGVTVRESLWSSAACLTIALTSLSQETGTPVRSRDAVESILEHVR